MGLEIQCVMKGVFAAWPLNVALLAIFDVNVFLNRSWACICIRCFAFYPSYR